MHTRAHTHTFTNTHILNTHHAPILQAQPSHPAIHMRHLHHTWQTSIYMIKHTHFNKNTHILNTHIFTNTHTSSTRTMRPSFKLSPSTLPLTSATTTTPDRHYHTHTHVHKHAHPQHTHHPQQAPCRSHAPPQPHLADIITHTHILTKHTHILNTHTFTNTHTHPQHAPCAHPASSTLPPFRPHVPPPPHLADIITHTCTQTHTHPQHAPCAHPASSTLPPFRPHVPPPPHPLPRPQLGC